MNDCIFCGIIAKKTPARIVYEDALALAFEDIAPQAPVHVLIVPKKHIPTTLELAPGEDDALVGHLLQVASRIAKEKGVALRGYRLVMNTNPEAGQSVYHVHLHMLGGRRFHWPPG